MEEARDAVFNYKVIELPSLTLENNERPYSVLETYAEIGNGGVYRIRMIYNVLGNQKPEEDCILMGQEIIDISTH